MRLVSSVSGYENAEVADPPERTVASDAVAAGSHFVDRGHPPKRHESRSVRTRDHASQPTGLAASLCQLHSQVAPFAGAIVALALVASAGLLYWMIVSPSRALIDEHQIGQFGFGSSSAPLPKFAPRSSTIGMSGPIGHDLPWWDALDVKSDTLAGPLGKVQPTQLPEQLQTLSIEEPVPEPLTKEISSNISEQRPSPPSESKFLTTDHPAALDFAKIGAAAEGKVQGGSSQPEVANLAVPNVLTPTKR